MGSLVRKVVDPWSILRPFDDSISPAKRVRRRFLSSVTLVFSACCVRSSVFSLTWVHTRRFGTVTFWATTSTTTTSSTGAHRANGTSWRMAWLGGVYLVIGFRWREAVWRKERRSSRAQDRCCLEDEGHKDCRILVAMLTVWPGSRCQTEVVICMICGQSSCRSGLECTGALHSIHDESLEGSWLVAVVFVVGRASRDWPPRGDISSVCTVVQIHC